MSLASGGRALRRHPRRPRSLLRQDVGQNHLEHIAHRTRVAHADAARQLVAEAFGDVGRVGRRQDHGRQPRPARPQHLLPDAADRLDRPPRASAPRSWPRPPAPAVRSAPRPGRRPAPPPADGPSFHRAASARCTCTSVVSSNLAAPARRSACERTHVIATFADSLVIGPAVPVTRSVPAAGKARRLDEQHVAALAGCGQAQGDAGTAGPGGDLLVAEPRRPEPRGHPFRPHLPGQRKTFGPQARCSAGRARRCRRRGRARPARQRRKPPVTATPSAYRHRASRRLYTNVVGTLNHLAGSLLEGRDAQRSAGGRQRVAALPCNLAVGERPLAGFGERHELRAALMPASSISSCRCFRDLRTPSPRPRAGPRRCRALCGGQLLIVHSAWTTSRVAGPSTKRRPALGPTVLGWE